MPGSVIREVSGTDATHCLVVGYRCGLLVRALRPPPVLIGHCLGGFVVQILLD